MNWQLSKAAPGTFVQMQAVIIEIKHMTGQYGSYALGKAQDGPGQVESVLFTVAKDKPFPTDLAIGHRINGAGKWDANTQKMKFFFDSYAQQQVAPQTQAPVPNAYAGPSPVPSPAAAVVAPQPVHVPVGRDATGGSIERQCVVKAVCEVAARRSPMDVGEVVKWCVILHKWVTDGQDIPTMSGTVAGPPAAPFAPPPEFDPGTPDSDTIPF